MESGKPSSKKLIAIGISLAIIVAVLVIIFAPRRRRPVDRVTSLALMTMKSDLQGLALAELSVKRITGQFISDPETAGHLSTPGVNRPIITLVDTGWTATVTHKTIPGLRCAIGVYARNPLKRLARSGEVVCTE